MSGATAISGEYDGKPGVFGATEPATVTARKSTTTCKTVGDFCSSALTYEHGLERLPSPMGSA
jgi:hypothetical protein